jgi:hypothetical protein
LNIDHILFEKQIFYFALLAKYRADSRCQIVLHDVKIALVLQVYHPQSQTTECWLHSPEFELAKILLLQFADLQGVY